MVVASDPGLLLSAVTPRVPGQRAVYSACVSSPGGLRAWVSGLMGPR